MTRATLVIIVLLLALSAGAQGAPPSAAPPGYSPLDRIRAIVDEEVITHFELERALAPLINLGAGILNPEERMAWLAEKRKEVLAEHINGLLILQEARKLNMEVNPTDVVTHLNALKQQQGLDDDGLQRFVQAQGFRNIQAYEDHVEREILKARTVRLRIGGRIRPSKEEVGRVFKRDFYGGEAMDEVHAQHILVRLPPFVTAEQIKTASEKAHQVHKMALAQTQPFADLAAIYSNDKNASGGGDLGWFSRCTLDPDFERAVFKLKMGQISGVERTNFGFHVIKVLGKRKVPIPDKTAVRRLRRCVRMDLEQANTRKAYDAFTAELRVYHHVVEID